MRTLVQRLGIAAIALAIGYSIRSIIAGAYWLTPFALALAVVLVLTVLRTGTTPRRHP